MNGGAIGEHNMALSAPLSRRLNMARQRYLPRIVWLCAVVLVVLLMGRQGRRIDAVGIAEVRGATVAPLFDGTIQSLSVDLLDEVRAGQPLVVMDDTLVQTELIIAKAELARLHAELEVRQQELKLDGMAAQRRFALDAEVARVDYLTRVAEHEANKAALGRLEAMCKLQGSASDSDLLARTTSDQTRLQYETLRKEVAENEVALDAAKTGMQETERRRNDTTQLYGDLDWARLLGPFQEQVRAQETRLSDILQRTQFLVLRAPLDGKVSTIFYRTGETVLAGTPVLAVASPDSQRVLAYLPERSLRDVQVGAIAEVHSRRIGGPAARGKVLRVGSRIEDMPIALWRNPMTAERGLSILVGDLPTGRFYPGEALDLRFVPANKSL